jgi:hypothetical protein
MYPLGVDGGKDDVTAHFSIPKVSVFSFRCKGKTNRNWREFRYLPMCHYYQHPLRCDLQKAAQRPFLYHMLLTEWNTEEWGEVRWEEGREECQSAVLDLLRQGYSAEQIEAMLADIRNAKASGAVGK